MKRAIVFFIVATMSHQLKPMGAAIGGGFGAGIGQAIMEAGAAYGLNDFGNIPNRDGYAASDTMPDMTITMTDRTITTTDNMLGRAGIGPSMSMSGSLATGAVKSSFSCGIF
jgi:hypothetical protein